MALIQSIRNNLTGTAAKIVVGIIAGGDIALKESIEGAEDSNQNSIKQLKEIG